ncbi:hypothetical protein VTO73DRAFT_10564 [Trametes versicolor]
MSEAQKSKRPDVSITSSVPVMRKQDPASPGSPPRALKLNRRSRPKRSTSPVRHNDEVIELASGSQDIARRDTDASMSPRSIGMPIANIKLLAQADDNNGGWYLCLHAREASSSGIRPTDDVRVTAPLRRYLPPVEPMSHAAFTTATRHAVPVVTTSRFGHRTVPSQDGKLKALIDGVVTVCCLFSAGFVVWAAPPSIWPVIWTFVQITTSVIVQCLWVTAAAFIRFAVATSRVLLPAACKLTNAFVHLSFAIWTSMFAAYVQA